MKFGSSVVEKKLCDFCSSVIEQRRRAAYLVLWKEENSCTEPLREKKRGGAVGHKICTLFSLLSVNHSFLDAATFFTNHILLSNVWLVIYFLTCSVTCLAQFFIESFWDMAVLTSCASL